jgi:hypothetical protein
VTFVFVVVGVAVIFVIAAVVIGRETSLLSSQPPRPVFDLDEAVQFVADELPFEVAAELTHDDVRQILRWHLEYFRTKGVSSNGQSHDAQVGPIIVGGGETVDYVLDKASSQGSTYTAAQVHAVLDAQLRYLQAIGAIGPPAQPDDGGDQTGA